VLKDGKQVPVMAAVTSVTGLAQSSPSEMMSPGGGSAPSGGSSGSSGSSGSVGGSAPSASSAPVMATTGQSGSTPGCTLTSAQDRVPVGNMPGVILSASSAPGTAGTVEASGDNISLDSGTKLTLNMAAGGSPAGQ